MVVAIGAGEGVLVSCVSVVPGSSQSFDQTAWSKVRRNRRKTEEWQLRWRCRQGGTSRSCTRDRLHKKEGVLSDRCRNGTLGCSYLIPMQRVFSWTFLGQSWSATRHSSLCSSLNQCGQRWYLWSRVALLQEPSSCKLSQYLHCSLWYLCGDGFLAVHWWHTGNIVVG